MRTSSYKNPYAHIPDADDIAVVQFQVGKADRDFLRCLDPDFGFITYLGAQAIKTLASDFRNAGLKHYDPENADKLRAIIARRFGPIGPTQDPAQETPGQAGRRDDKGGVGLVRQASPDHPVDTTPVDSADRVRRGPRRGSKKAVETEGIKKEGRGSGTSKGVRSLK